MGTKHARNVLPMILALFLLAEPVLCGNFFITSPKIVRPGTEYTVAVAILDTPDAAGAAVVTVSLKEATGALIVQDTKNLNDGDGDTFELQVPSDVTGTSAILEVSSTGGAVFNNQTYVKIEQKKGIILIQTDKGIYKPGQLVLMRAVCMDSTMKPLSSSVTISIKDGNNNKIREWSDLQTDTGVVSENLQLSDDPVLGEWTIMAESDGIFAERKFTVDEYVLPRFETNILVDPQVSEKDNTLTVTVESKYTFGKLVHGNLRLEVRLQSMPIYYFDIAPMGRPPRPGRQPSSNNDVIDSVIVPDYTGRYVQTYNLANLKSEGQFYADSNYPWDIEVWAKVTEDGTGETANDTKPVKVYPQDVQVKFLDTEPKVYHSGMGLNTFLKVTNSKGQPLTNPSIYMVKISFQSMESQESFDHNIPADGIVRSTFSVPENTNSLTIMAVVQKGSENVSFADITLWEYQSPQNYSIQLTQISHDVNPEENIVPDQVVPSGGTVRFQVDSNFIMPNLFYAVIGRGKVLRFSRLNPPPNGNVAKFSFSVDRDMAPHFYIVVYSFVEPADGQHEIVADGQVFEVVFTLENQVTIAFSQAESKVKEMVELTVTAEPLSYVGISAVDKAVLLLADGNDIDKSRVLAEIAGFDLVQKPENDCHGFFCSRRWMWKPRKSADSFFSDFGLVYLTDTLVSHALMNDDRGPIDYEIYEAVDYPNAYFDDMDGNQGQSASDESSSDATSLRKYFPETWLWIEETTSANGEYSQTVTVPDSITTWVASAFAINANEGLGIPDNKAMLLAFQTFFVDAVVPYSVVRGEKFSVEIVTFNYHDTTVQADVVLESSEQFYIGIGDNVYAQQEFRETIEIPSQRQTTVVVWVKPRVLDEIQLNIQAVSSATIRDAIEKTVIVKPEGQQRYSNRHWTISFDGSQTESMEFVRNITEEYPPGKVPSVVEDSWRVEAMLIGDVIGPALDGIDKLVQRPTGCGEQNMITMVPNLVLLKYYKSSSKSNPAVEAKATEYTEKGYQRELTYMHLDYSFSAFLSDPSGSTWLSAFVLKSFCQAREFVFIDGDILKNTAAWLINQQNSATGMFAEPGRVIHDDMQGGVTGSEETMAAFVLIALLECGAADLENGNSNLVQNAIDLTTSRLKSKVVNGELPDKPYTLALVGYALQLAGEDVTVGNILDIMDGLAVDEDGKRSWSMATTSDREQPPRYCCQSAGAPLAVETSSYALLIYTLRGDVSAGFPVLRYITGFSNPFGGYCSTQDTVVGLQAVAEFSGIMTNNLQLDVSLTQDGGPQQSFAQITQDNSDVLQRMILTRDTEVINVQATGQGTAILQVIWKYNVLGRSTDNGLHTDVTLRPASKDVITMNICVSYDGQEDIGMSTVSAMMLTGFKPEIAGGSFKNADKTEVSDDSVTIYLNKVPERQECFEFDSRRVKNIADNQPALVTASSYYKPEIEQLVAYSIPEGAKRSECDMCAGQCKSCPKDPINGSNRLTWSSLILVIPAISFIMNRL